MAEVVTAPEPVVLPFLIIVMSVEEMLPVWSTNLFSETLRSGNASAADTLTRLKV